MHSSHRVAPRGLHRLLLMLICTGAHAQLPSAVPFFGLQATDSAQLVAPGFVSTGLGERDGCFTPEGKEFYYSLWTGTYGTIVSTRLHDSGWSPPEVLPFSGRYSDLEAAITPDGMRMYFASNRPLTDGGPPKDYDIWYVDRRGPGWGEPVNLGAPVNTAKDEFFPSVSRRGDLYVTAEIEGTFGGEDIFTFERRGDGFGPPSNLGPGVNSTKGEFNAFVDPDERFILFSSFGRSDQVGGGDLYISERRSDGTWGAARVLRLEVNSNALDYCPWVSPDGSWLLFSSRRPAQAPYWASRRSVDDIRASRGRAENGQDDIYVVSTVVLHRIVPAH